jgi:O-acetyl-ADP-ribose deacetylase (regulator of RNase III)
MLPSAIFLRTTNPKLANAWNEVFESVETIQVARGDYFEQPADAMVSPANSFGIMDGGLDAAILEHLGANLQGRVQDLIRGQWHGEMPVGTAAVVATDNLTWPYLVVAPTMRVPENVSLTLNAYLAFRAILLAVKQFNEVAGAKQIDSLLVSGLATGVGAMEPRRCAAQMRVAYRYLSDRPRIPSFNTIYEVHKKMRNAI